MRRLAIVLGDQLNVDSALFDDFDSSQDGVWMAEVVEESTHVWSHKARIALFLSGMRHFRDALRERGIPVLYRELDEDATASTLGGQLAAAIARNQPREVVGVWPGDWRVKQSLEQAAAEAGCPLTWLPDRHFLCDLDEFARHAQGRKQLRMEYFYREMRRQHDVLMNGKEPIGGAWNFDHANRGSFGNAGPPRHAEPLAFPPDATTQEVLRLVATRFANHPGSLDRFDWPVTADQALTALEDFIACRLPHFGIYQDAMWMDEPWLFHSRLSAALNLKLLDPRDVIEAAVGAYASGAACLESVEGFVRQILGWREYVRGIYWLHMPDYLSQNSLHAEEPLPDFYWTGNTGWNCLQQTIGQTLQLGYAHHIQRLMVTGLFSLLLGVRPTEVHAWYLAVYVDAVEWVELPNTLGMSQYADGGYLASKPYVATGKYIQRMSNYCAGCRCDPSQATGERACPFTTLYWDFLQRHRERLMKNPRMSLQVKNLDRMDAATLAAVRNEADALRDTLRQGRALPND